MISVIDFKADHMEYLLKTGIADHQLGPFLKPEQGVALEKVGGSYTVMEDSKPVAIGGVLKYWDTRGEAWLLVGKPSTHGFPIIFKKIRNFLKDTPIKRVEMVVAHDWKNGHRWARLLGFKKEADTLASYLPDGRDVSLYSMVRS